MIERSCGTAPPSGTELTSPCMGRDHLCCLAEGKERRAQRRRQALRPATRADRGDLEGEAHKRGLAAAHLLVELERRRAESGEPGRG